MYRNAAKMVTGSWTIQAECVGTALSEDLDFPYCRLLPVLWQLCGSGRAAGKFHLSLPAGRTVEMSQQLPCWLSAINQVLLSRSCEYFNIFCSKVQTSFFLWFLIVENWQSINQCILEWVSKESVTISSTATCYLARLPWLHSRIMWLTKTNWGGLSHQLIITLLQV